MVEKETRIVMQNRMGEETTEMSFMAVDGAATMPHRKGYEDQ